MIASVHGKLLVKENTYAVIECGGVGLKCFLTQNAYCTLGNVGSDAFLYTYLAVREDALDLFGFSTEAELEMFKLITSVSGVGPKIGLAILSEFTADQIMLSIASNDAKTLTSASGVGLKLAQRIILELKDKVSGVPSGNTVGVVGNAVSNTNGKEAIEALVSLGYSQSEASLAVSRLDGSLSTDNLIKQALKLLSRGL